MKYIYLLLTCLILSCTPITPPVVTPVQKITLPSTNTTLTIIEQSVRYNVFSLVYTNTSFRVNFTNAIYTIDTDLNTSNYDTTALINGLKTSNNVVYQTISPSLTLLSYYVTNNNDGIGGFNALKTGIQEGLSQ
jgi:hypothetical protein